MSNFWGAVHLDDKLYLNSTLSWDDSAQLIYVNKNRSAEIIQESTGNGLNEYLNGLRIEHAIYLMKQFDNYTLQAIAVASDFSNMSTFHSLFKKEIEMPPSLSILGHLKARTSLGLFHCIYSFQFDEVTVD